MTKTHPYYKFDALASHNAMWNFVCGARGLGKTFGRKEIAIGKAIKADDYQFIYLRRYNTELSVAKATFFDDLKAKNKFPDWDFRVQGPLAQAAHVKTRDDKKREWKTIGYFVALSTAQTQKSVSFPHVKEIIFDEFIVERGATPYISNEADVFRNFYSTVDRWQDKTKVYFLANSVSIMNPYFLVYGIVPDEGEEWVRKAFIPEFGRYYVVAHFPEAKDFQSSVHQTMFGKFIQDTDYDDYAVGNGFSDNHGNLLTVKNPKARYQFTLETKRGSFSIWRDSRANEYFITSKLPKQNILYTLVPENMSADKVLMDKSDKLMSYLRTAFRQGRVTFNLPATRNTFAEIFTR